MEFQVTKSQTYAILKGIEKLNNFFKQEIIFPSPAGMKEQRNEGGGRILLGDNTGGEEVTLRQIRFQCGAVWSSTRLT
jgi:hypothetical protein